MNPSATLAAALDAALPQTQCTRCGYADCAAYAHAIAHDEAAINQCPPGGRQGIERLARLTGQAVLPLNPAHGDEGPLRLAFIDEAACIGCALCLKACPVDCIIGAPKLMHTVAAAQCTGCELCLPACPVDCITMLPAQRRADDATEPAATGWDAWSPARAEQARQRYAQRGRRLAREQHERSVDQRALADAALARVRARAVP